MSQIKFSDLFEIHNLYKMIYGTGPFPFWVTVQALWSIYITQVSLCNQPRSFLTIFNKFLSSFVLTFIPRELIAICFEKESPILNHPLSLLIFIVTFALFELLNLKYIFHKLALDFGLGFLQGLNQMKLFTLMLRTIDAFEGGSLLVVSLIFTSLDQCFHLVFRYAFQGLPTNGCNFGSIIRTIITFFMYWFCTHILDLNVTKSALISAYILGIINGLILLFSKLPSAKKSKRRTE